MKTELTIKDWALCIGQKLIIDGGDSYIIEEVGRGHLHLKGLNMKVVPTFCKPILRTLDQMTEDEKQEFKKEFYDFPEFGKVVGIIIDDFVVKVVIDEFYEFGQIEKMQSISIDGMDWLTQKGFDIRGWIEAGLAIKEADNDTK